MLEIGTFLPRSETELVLKSRRVVPGRLLDAGFSFDRGEWADAARELCERTRNLRGQLQAASKLSKKSSSPSTSKLSE
jgi:uncharacterized protein